MLTAAVPQSLAQADKFYRDGREWVEEHTGTLDGASRLKVATDMGSVRIRGGQQPGITYLIKKRVSASTEQEARRLLDLIRISAGVQGELAVIRGQAPNNYGRNRLSSDFEIHVPLALTAVSVRTGGGNLDASGFNGRIDAETGGGSLQLDNIGGIIAASSGGGNVDVGTAGSDVRVETGGGSIHVRSANGVLEAHSGGGPIQIDWGKQRMELETGGSDINVNSTGNDLKASTGGGNINVGAVNGKAYLDTGGGSIRLGSANGLVHATTGGGSVELYKLSHGAQVETGGGGIVAEFVGSSANFSDSRLETAAGDIRVYLPGDLPVTVRAAIDVSNGHKIHSEFNNVKVISEGPDWGPKESYCEGKLNGGGPMLHVHTTSGNIDLLKRTYAAEK